MDQVLIAANNGTDGLEYYLIAEDLTLTSLGDINPGPGSGAFASAQVASIGSEFLFVANNGADGNELFISDGTTEGTEFLRDIKPGTLQSSSPFHLTGAGPRAFFFADDGVHGFELWVSDGTPGGTQMVVDLNPSGSALALADSTSREIVPFGDGVIFTATDGASGLELWFSDGTEDGTVMLTDRADIAGDPLESGANPFYSGTNIANGLFFFAAEDGASGFELYATDGTAAGTRRVADIASGPGSSLPRDFAAVGGEVFFSASNGTGSRQLYSSNGSPGSALRITDAPLADFDPQNIAPLGDGEHVVFSAVANGVGRELFMSDGSTAGLLADIRQGPFGSSPADFALTSAGLFFVATDDGGRDLFTTDGTAEGTVQVGNLNLTGTGAAPIQLTAFGAAVGYSADVDFGGGTDFGREPAIGTLFPPEAQFVNLAQGAASSNPIVHGPVRFNSAPVRDDAPGQILGIDENSPAGGVVAGLLFDDPDGDLLTFELSGPDADDLTFTTQSLNDLTEVVVTTLRPFNFEEMSELSYTVTATDPFGESVAADATSPVFDLNDAPTLTLVFAAGVPETAAPGFVAVAIRDVNDEDGDEVTLSLIDDGGGLVAFDGENIVVAAPLDFETTPDFFVMFQADDGNGGVITSNLPIALNEEDEPPQDLTLDLAGTLPEDAPISTVVGMVSAIDPEGGAVSFSLSGDEGGTFALIGDTLVTTDTLNFETVSSYEITLVAEDAGGLFTTLDITVDVADVDETGNTIFGTPEDDPALMGVAGRDDIIDGLAGTDTVVLDDPRAEITETVFPNGTISILFESGELDTLLNIARVELTDGAYLFDIRQEAEQTYRLYGASLARLPDEPGLRFWDGLRESGAISVDQLAQAFVDSPEFASLFGGAEPSTDDFIEALYQNVLRRAPDDPGRAFWTTAFETGVPRFEMLKFFSESPENVALNADNYDDGFLVIG